MKFRRNFQEKEKLPGEVNHEPSMTVPDQTISMKKLIENHVRGIPSDVRMYQGQYLGIEIPKITDLTDLAAYREQLEEYKQQIQERIREELAAKQAKAPENTPAPEQTPPEGGA